MCAVSAIIFFICTQIKKLQKTPWTRNITMSNMLQTFQKKWPLWGSSKKCNKFIPTFLTFHIELGANAPTSEIR